MDNDRLFAVTYRLTEYVKSPSLRHIRDPRSLHNLAKEILLAVERTSSIWAKWEGSREEIAKAAAPCWIPTKDLQAFLNTLPGPVLTHTDVVQRLRVFHEEPWGTYPKDELKDGCLALYNAEKARGTELPAIIGALQEHIELEEERLRREREETYRQRMEDERISRQQTFLSGADCGWTQIGNSEAFCCRRNGRMFRIARDNDKRWKLYRVVSLEEGGILLGTYQSRREASKAVAQIAYAPEPR